MHDLPTRVGPGAKLEVTLLVVKGEPGDVDLAGGLEDARGDVEHGAVLGDHDVRLERPVESFIGAARLLGMASCKAEGVARLGYFYCYFFLLITRICAAYGRLILGWWTQNISFFFFHFRPGQGAQIQKYGSPKLGCQQKRDAAWTDIPQNRPISKNWAISKNVTQHGQIYPKSEPSAKT